MATITVAVIQMKIVSRRWKSQEHSKIEDKKNGVAFTRAVVIQTRNVTSRRVAVNLRTVLLLLTADYAN